MQIRACGRNFPDMPMNMLDQQFFQLQLNASNLYLLFEVTDDGALTFDGLDTQNQNTSVELRGAPIYQGATDLYYIVDTSGKRPPYPILCTVHDTFWLFSPVAGGICIYDTNHSFDEVIGLYSA
ncbi:MAG: hypothetical protein EZS28_000570 [Streblomastix strix]|uniref:Uncharacterized protein n=1 Tax=Streblomastix strix TaxID=222440 RepID=A0A5J4X9W9_9EUKA|nr:MAG: hypothetical protein EZS28_000570 [Streblomastix strix]